MPDYFYEVALEYQGMAVDARVNDGPLWLSRSRDGGRFELDANRWIHPKRNVFSYRFYPYPGDAAIHPEFFARVSVHERRQGVPMESAREIAAASYTAADGAAFGRTDDGGFVVSLEFDADVEFPPWTWTAAPRIARSPETMASLLREIDTIHALLAARNAAALAERVRERDREFAIAHYEDPRYRFATTLRDFERMVSNPKLPLEPRETRNLELRLYGDGRLARIEDENGDSPIYFLSLDESIVSFVPFTFCQKSDRSWLVIR